MKLFLLLTAFIACLFPVFAFAAESDVEVLVETRQATWSQKDPWYFDITVKNRSKADIEVPFIYDSVIEIDGKTYTQFPKPRIEGKPNRVVPAGEDVKHGTLTLNGNAFSTVDAKTGKIPLKLGPGDHTLRLILGDHQSSKISFKVVD